MYPKPPGGYPQGQQYNYNQQYPQQAYPPQQQSPYGQQPYNQQPFDHNQQHQSQLYGQAQRADSPNNNPNPHNQAKFFPAKSTDSYKRHKGNSVVSRHPPPPPGFGGVARHQSPIGYNSVPPQPPRVFPPTPYQGYQQFPLPPPTGFPVPFPPPNYRGYQQPQGYPQTPFNHQPFVPPPPNPYGVPPPPIPSAPRQPLSQPQWLPPPIPIPHGLPYGSPVATAHSSSYVSSSRPSVVVKQEHSTPVEAPIEPKHESPVEPKIESPEERKVESSTNQDASSEAAASDSRTTDHAPGPSKITHNYAGWDQDECEYEGSEPEPENFETRTELSIGTVVWHPGNPVSRVIPGVYAAAEAQARNPPPPPRSDMHESVSRYATVDNLEESCLSVRYTDHWDRCRDDPVFAKFPEDDEIVPMYQVIANRLRPGRTATPMDVDDEIEEGEVGRGYDSEAREEDYPEFSVTNNLEHALDAGVQIKEEQPSCVIDQHIGIVNRKEKEAAAVEKEGEEKAKEAAKVEEEENKEGEEEDEEEEPYSPPPADAPEPERTAPLQLQPVPESVSSTDSIFPPQDIGKEANGVSIESESNTTQEIEQRIEAPPFMHKLPQKPEPVASRVPLSITPTGTTDDTQEDILARLGVTGPPQPVVNTPGPAYRLRSSPIQPSRDRSRSPQRSPPNDVPTNGLYSSHRERDHQPLSIPEPPPPPPPPPVQPAEPDAKDDPWGANYGNEGSRASPKSEASQHTLVGSDFHEDAPDTIEIMPLTESIPSKTAESPPHLGSSSSRKRRRTASEERDDGVKRQEDDVTPRLRRRQPRVAAAYGRRW